MNLLPSGSEQHEVLLFGSIKEGILQPRGVLLASYCLLCVSYISMNIVVNIQNPLTPYFPLSLHNTPYRPWSV